jgi:hypothetical protein
VMSSRQASWSQFSTFIPRNSPTASRSARKTTCFGNGNSEFPVRSNVSIHYAEPPRFDFPRHTSNICKLHLLYRPMSCPRSPGGPGSDFQRSRPARCRLAAVARGGAYFFGAGNGSRTGSGRSARRLLWCWHSGIRRVTASASVCKIRRPRRFAESRAER